MDFLTFPIVALGLALICLIGVALYALTARATLRTRDEQIVVARAQAYAMLELSQAGILFLDRDHCVMGEASAAAPELLGHTCDTGTPFSQVLAELVDDELRANAVNYLESLWTAAPTAEVDATLNPLARVHSASRHLAIRFARLVVDQHVNHIIVSIERVAAPRVVPHTIEVPILNEETFARRMAGETGLRPALKPEQLPPEAAMILARPDTVIVAAAVQPAGAGAQSNSTSMLSKSLLTGEFELGPLDVTEDSLPSLKVPFNEAMNLASLARITIECNSTPATPAVPIAALTPKPRDEAAPFTDVGQHDTGQHLATTIASADVMQPAMAVPPLAAAIVDPRDPRRTAVLNEVVNVEGARLEHFLAEARDKAGQLRAIIKLPAREPQAFREKLVLILELIRGVHARAERLPLPSVCERAQRFEEALGKLRDKQTLSGNDFLPLAVKLDDLLSHLAVQGEVVARLVEWRKRHGNAATNTSPPPADPKVAATGTTIRQPKLRRSTSSTTTIIQPGEATQKTARLADLTRESLEELANFLADMYGKRASLVVVGLEDVPGNYRRIVEKILGQLIHNAIRHGLESPPDRVVQDKPEIGTVAVQFARAGADGYQLSVQDDGRGLDHDKIRAEAVRQGVLTAAGASNIDPRKLASLIFRPGFTTVDGGGARGIGMDVVRELVSKAGGRVGIATKPGEYTRFRITLPHEKKDSNAAVA